MFIIFNYWLDRGTEQKPNYNPGCLVTVTFKLGLQAPFILSFLFSVSL